VIKVLDDTQDLESMLKDKNKRIEIISFFEELLNEKIKDYNYISIEKFNSIIEYDFSLVKVNILFNNNKQKKIYFRIIKGGKVKESIFCYWSLLYEEYCNCDRNDLPHKVSITEKLIEKNKKNIVLTIDKDLNYYTEICLIEIKKFLEDKAKENCKLKGLMKYFSNNDKDILFLGII